MARGSWLAATMGAIFLCVLFYGFDSHGQGPDSCECVKQECDPCHTQEGLTFYTEKCEGGVKVKSCARPTCVMRNPLPAGCQAQAKDADQRLPASEEKSGEVQALAESRGEKVGVVALVKGSAWLVRPDGEKLALKQGLEIFEKDKLITEKDARVQVNFKDNNEMTVTEGSQVKIKEYKSSAEARRALLELLHGQVRNKVLERPKDKSSRFEIVTKAAVAGVRGTDFVVTYKPDPNNTDKVLTRVDTFKGEVELSAEDREQQVLVAAGEYASFVVDNSSSSLFSDEEIKDFVARGYMTPVYKMSAKQMSELDLATRLTASSIKVAKAKAERAVCTEPRAEFNQCLWTCQNNPGGEEKCRTDISNVYCVRKRCNANGKWSEESRLPAAFHESCEPTGNKVAPCDY